MTTPSPQTSDGQPRDAVNWAESVSTLKVLAVPAGAVNLNVDGRRVNGALQGFGQLWQKTYRIKLAGATVTPRELMQVWKEHFPEFHPPESRFYPSFAGVQPGEVLLINASLTGLPVYTGVMVIYADDGCFTVMTAEGLPEAGWNTFSVYEEDGCIVAQVQSIARANDPIYEIGFRLIGSRAQEKIWRHVLTQLAACYGVQAEVELAKQCVDPRLQWANTKNIWHNAALRSMLYMLTSPVRKLRGLGRRPS